MHRIGQYVLENTFLTANDTVAMQWVDKKGNALTLWRDKTGNVRNTSTVRVSEEVFRAALQHYLHNWKKVSNPRYHK